MCWTWRRSPSASADTGDRPPEDEHVAARQRMVRHQIAARGLTDPDLLHAFAKVPRHAFVRVPGAYADRALPVGKGQTISQPYIVALMTDAAQPRSGYRGSRVLEVGTGSGYQAAILAELGAQVTTIERHPELSERATAALREHGYADVRVLVGDGTRGWPEGAPYDAIIVGAAGRSVPPPLLEQLRDGGRLVMPVGGRQHQAMLLVERRGDEFVARELEGCSFVPLIGAFGWRAR